MCLLHFCHIPYKGASYDLCFCSTCIDALWPTRGKKLSSPGLLVNVKWTGKESKGSEGWLWWSMDTVRWYTGRGQHCGQASYCGCDIQILLGLFHPPLPLLRYRTSTPPLPFWLRNRIQFTLYTPLPLPPNCVFERVSSTHRLCSLQRLGNDPIFVREFRANCNPMRCAVGGWAWPL